MYEWQILFIFIFVLFADYCIFGAKLKFIFFITLFIMLTYKKNFFLLNLMAKFVEIKIYLYYARVFFFLCYTYVQITQSEIRSHLFLI